MPPKKATKEVKKEESQDVEMAKGDGPTRSTRSGRAGTVVEPKKRRAPVAKNGADTKKQKKGAEEGAEVRKRGRPANNGKATAKRGKKKEVKEVATGGDADDHVVGDDDDDDEEEKETESDEIENGEKIESAHPSEDEEREESPEPKDDEDEKEEDVEEKIEKPKRGKKAKATKEVKEKPTKDIKEKEASAKDDKEATDEEDEQDAGDHDDDKDDKDDKDSKDSKEVKDSKDAKDVKEVKEAKEAKDTKAPKVAKGKKKAVGKSKKKKVEPSEDEPKKKRGRVAKKIESEPVAEPVKVLQNQTETDYASIDFACTKTNKLGKEFNLKITSWNVDGLRAWVKKNGVEFFTHENPDIICLQETKCSEEQLPEELNEKLSDYKRYWLGSDKSGYAGVAILTKSLPIEVYNGIKDETQDTDGRCITAEFERFYLVCTYVPNAGRKLVTLPRRLEWNKSFASYVQSLNEKKPVIIAGDMNVAHTEIDLANPKTNRKNAGFTQEERDGMTDFIKTGFVDTYRHFYPDTEKAYTFWTYMMKSRLKNVGWRLDYFLVSERFIENLCDNIIRKDVFGSDHCPITLFLNV